MSLPPASLPTQNPENTWSPFLPPHTHTQTYHAFTVRLQQCGFCLRVSRLVRQPQGDVRQGAWWGTAAPVPRTVPHGPRGHGPGLLFYQHGFHILSPCQAVLSILGWILCKWILIGLKSYNIMAGILMFSDVSSAGGGLRDSWNNIMEKTFDTGGMYICIWITEDSSLYPSL